MKRPLCSLLAAALLSATLIAPAGAQDEELAEPLNFRWTSVSENTTKGTTDQVEMSGNGWLIDGEFRANGTYNHAAGGDAPQALLSYGTWRADDLMEVDIIATYGAVAAGRIMMAVTLYPEGEDPIPAVLTMISNVPWGGLLTDLPEGFFLETGSTLFAPIPLSVAEGATPAMTTIGAATINVLEDPPA